MKLDKVGVNQYFSPQISINFMIQDNSGTIERDEFLSLPQVSSNPLATRYFAPLPSIRLVTDSDVRFYYVA